MIQRLLFSAFSMFFTVVTVAQAQPVPVAVSASSAVSPASAFQVIDDVRAENEDADLAYIRTTLARNQAAIDAAKAVLKTSFDADVRMMAGDSMKLHDSELRTMKAWLRLHGPQEPLPAAVSPSATPTVTPTQLRLPTTGQVPAPVTPSLQQALYLSPTTH